MAAGIQKRIDRQFGEDTRHLPDKLISQTKPLTLIPSDHLIDIGSNFWPYLNSPAHKGYRARNWVRNSSKGIAVPGARS